MSENINLDQPVQFTLEWIKYDGYSETHQLVDESGRICSHVKGSRANPQDGWEVIYELWNPWISMGRYVTLEQAKSAAEEIIAMVKAQDLIDDSEDLSQNMQELNNKKVN